MIPLVLEKIEKEQSLSYLNGGFQKTIQIFFVMQPINNTLL